MACYILSKDSAKGQLALKTLSHRGSTEGSKKPSAKLEGTIAWLDLGLIGGQSGSKGKECSRWCWVDSQGGVNACLSNGSCIQTLIQPHLSHRWFYVHLAVCTSAEGLLCYSENFKKRIKQQSLAFSDHLITLIISKGFYYRQRKKHQWTA